VTDYFGAGMRLYLERLVDWEGLLELRRGGAADVPTEVAAYVTLLETTAKLAASFERGARELIAAMVTHAAPRNRDDEAAKARARAAQRFGARGAQATGP